MNKFAVSQPEKTPELVAITALVNTLGDPYDSNTEAYRLARRDSSTGEQIANPIAASVDDYKIYEGKPVMPEEFDNWTDRRTSEWNQLFKVASKYAQSVTEQAPTSSRSVVIELGSNAAVSTLAQILDGTDKPALQKTKEIPERSNNALEGTMPSEEIQSSKGKIEIARRIVSEINSQLRQNDRN